MIDSDFLTENLFALNMRARAATKIEISSNYLATATMLIENSIESMPDPIGTDSFSERLKRHLKDKITQHENTLKKLKSLL